MPGHGDHGGVEFAREQLRALQALADLGRRVEAGELDVEAAVAATPFPAYPADDIRQPLERTLAQIRGELA